MPTRSALPVWSLLAATFLLTGCGSASSEDPPATDPGGDATDVTLEELNAQFFSTTGSQDVAGRELVAGTTIQISFDGRTVSARAGCNHLSGSAEIADGMLSVSGLGGTEMGCPDDLMAQDDWLIGFLSSQPSITLEDDVLTLAGGEEEVRLARVERDVETVDPDQPTSNG